MRFLQAGRWTVAAMVLAVWAWAAHGAGVGTGVGANAGVRQTAAQQPAQAAALPASDLMVWAQAAYPDLFPGLASTQSVSINGLDYQLRTYALPEGGYNMLAVGSDAQVAVMGSLTGGALLRLGTLADFNCLVYPGRCQLGSAGVLTQQKLALAFLNQERQRCGYSPLAEHVALNAAASAHAAYLAQNQRSARTEDPNLPGYYAATPLERAVRAGYLSSTVREGRLATLDASAISALRGMLSTPYQASVLLADMRDVGLSFRTPAGPAAAGVRTDLVLALGRPAGQGAATKPPLRTYPCEGSTDTLYTSAVEAPAPFPLEPGAKWGQAVVVTGGADLRVTSATITGPSGPVAIKALYGDGATTDPNALCTNGVACVLPQELQPGTRYTVALAGTHGGLPFSTSFSHTTVRAADTVGTAPAGKVQAVSVPMFQKPFDGEFRLVSPMDHSFPLDYAETNGAFTSFWGEANTALNNFVDGHAGYDFPMPTGTPIYAVADGVVYFADTAGAVTPTLCPPINQVISIVSAVQIHHTLPDGRVVDSSYVHLDSIAVKVGDRVVAGQLIGRSGNIGCSTGPHLHFQTFLRQADNSKVTIDPFGWSGAQQDPWEAHPSGAASLALWVPGKAPKLERYLAYDVTTRTPFAPAFMTKIVYQGIDDAKNPNNEYVDMGLDPRYASIAVLDGYKLFFQKSNLMLPLPSGYVLTTQRPSVRVYIGPGTNDANTIYLGQAAGIISNNADDCLRVYYPSGGFAYLGLGSLTCGTR